MAVDPASSRSPAGLPPPAGSLVVIRLLGGFTVRVDRGEAPDTAVLPRRGRELLQLLSLQPGRSLTREEVVEALWPHLEPAAAGANLRKAAHHARRFLDLPDALLLRSGRVFLFPGRDVDCDVDRFEHAARAVLGRGDAQACRDVARLYTGDLLPDAVYEPWAQAPRQGLRATYLRLLREGGEFERLVQEDPGDEAGHVELMRTEIAAGRLSSALRWYGRLRDHLQSALGTKPGPLAQGLYESCIAALRDDEPAFVGRIVESSRAIVLLRGAGSDRIGGIWLRAAAGLGKTAFCRRLAREGRRLGWQVRLVQASDWTRPYGMAIDLIEPLLQEGGDRARQAVQSHAHAVLAALTPAAGRDLRLAMPIGRHQVAGAVRRLLLATAGGKPVLLIVDDAHAADDASADLLALLAASGAPLFIVLACRPTMSETLARPLARLVGSGRMESMELAPLDEEEAAALAACAAPVPLTRESAIALARRAEGIPFAVVELARVAGAGRGDGAGAAGLPGDVSTAIADRLCAFENDAMAALRRLALAADELEATAAVALARGSATDACELLDRALDSRVLIVDEGRYRFRHDLVREALLEGIPPHRRLAAHREVAERLERASAAPGLIGHHWLACSEFEAATPFVLAAARDAFRLGAFGDVLRHLDSLLGHRPAIVDALALRAESMEALGRPGTLAAYDAAVALAPPDLAEELKAKRALAQVKAGDAPGALRYLENVRPVTTAGRLAEALAYSGAAALGFGDPAEGTRRAAEVRRLALESGDEGTLVIASWAQAAAAHARGDLHGSVWADLHETAALPHLAVRVFDGHLCMTQRFLYGSRPYAAVIAFADAFAREAARLGADRGLAFAVTLRGEAGLLSGRLDQAEEDLVAGGRLHRAIGGTTGEALSLQRLAEIAMHRGRRDHARALLAEALDVARQSGVGFHLFDRIYGTRIMLETEPAQALDAVIEADHAVRGPIETCPGCRITFAIPATIASARAHELTMASDYLDRSEYLANVVMRLPAWHAALHEARGYVALASGEPARAQREFEAAVDGFDGAEQPLDKARCLSVARQSASQLARTGVRPAGGASGADIPRNHRSH